MFFSLEDYQKEYMAKIKLTKVFGGALASSADPEKLSLTLKAFVPLILAILPLSGVVGVTESDLLVLIDQIVIVVSASLFLYGVARKILNRLYNK